MWSKTGTAVGMPEHPAGEWGVLSLRVGASLRDNVLLPNTALPASALPTPGSSTARHSQHVPQFLPSAEGKLRLPSSSWQGIAKIFLPYVKYLRSADEKRYRRPRYSTAAAGPYVKNAQNTCI